MRLHLEKHNDMIGEKYEMEHKSDGRETKKW